MSDAEAEFLRKAEALKARKAAAQEGPKGNLDLDVAALGELCDCRCRECHKAFRGQALWKSDMAAGVVKERLCDDCASAVEAARLASYERQYPKIERKGTVRTFRDADPPRRADLDD